MPLQPKTELDSALTGDGIHPRLGVFVLLVAIMSVPFYALDPITRIELLPKLPVSAFAVVCPTSAALILTYRGSGVLGVKQFLRRSLAIGGTAPTGVLVATVLRPLATWLSYMVPAALSGPVSMTPISGASMVAMFGFFAVGAIAEEIGWTAYAAGQARTHHSTLVAGLQIGSVCAAWHVVPLYSAGRDLRWIAWWSLGTIATRVLFVWLYRSTPRGLWAVTLSHALHNLVWMCIPMYGSLYDPRSDAVATIAVTLIALAWCKRGRIAHCPHPHTAARPRAHRC